MHRGFLSGRGGTVDADVTGDRVRLLVLVPTFVRGDEPAGARVAGEALPVLVLLGAVVQREVGLLLGQLLVQALALELFELGGSVAGVLRLVVRG